MLYLPLCELHTVSSNSAFDCLEWKDLSLKWSIMCRVGH